VSGEVRRIHLPRANFGEFQEDTTARSPEVSEVSLARCGAVIGIVRYLRALRDLHLFALDLLG
jgi:hypothetical protein